MLSSQLIEATVVNGISPPSEKEIIRNSSEVSALNLTSDSMDQSASLSTIANGSTLQGK